MNASETWDAYYGPLHLPDGAACTPPEVVRWAAQHHLYLRNAAACLISLASMHRRPRTARTEELPPTLFAHTVAALEAVARRAPAAQHTLPAAVVAAVTCPWCEAEGWNAPAYEGSEVTTAMGTVPRYDTQGRRHLHNPNAITTVCVCGHGHLWPQVRYHACWCGWPDAMAADVAWSVPTASAAERALLQVAASGHSDQEIAQAQGRHVSTVRRRISTLCRRWGVREERTQMVVVALQHGLIAVDGAAVDD